MPVVNQQPILYDARRVYDTFMTAPMPHHAPTPSSVGPQWCRPGTIHAYPNGDGRNRGTYYEKPVGGPVVTTPQGRPVAPRHTLPATPRGLPTPGGTIVGPPGSIGPGTTVESNGVPKRNWWPWLVAAGGAAMAVAGGR